MKHEYGSIILWKEVFSSKDKQFGQFIRGYKKLNTFLKGENLLNA